MTYRGTTLCDYIGRIPLLSQRDGHTWQTWHRLRFVDPFDSVRIVSNWRWMRVTSVEVWRR